MPTTKTNKIKKRQVKKLIMLADHLSLNEKERWVKLVDSMNNDQLKKTYDHFTKSITVEYKTLLKLSVKAGIPKECFETVKKTTINHFKNK